jgi:hypothetical protein
LRVDPDLEDQDLSDMRLKIDSLSAAVADTYMIACILNAIQ